MSWYDSLLSAIIYIYIFTYPNISWNVHSDNVEYIDKNSSPAHSKFATSLDYRTVIISFYTLLHNFL